MGLGSPLVAEYLNKKYGTKFPITPGGCNALATKAFVQPDGAMFPCQELTDTVPISYQEIINRAAGDPPFRSNLVADPEGTLDFYHYKVTDEDRTRLVSLISNMQDVVRANIRSAIERSAIQTETNPKGY